MSEKPAPAKGGHKKHYCAEHDAEVRPVMHKPGRKIRFHCNSGCSLSKQDTIRK